MTHIDCPSSLVDNSHRDPWAFRVQDDITRLRRTNCAWHCQRVEVFLIDHREGVHRRDRKKASIKSHFEVTVISADRMVNSDEVRSCFKSTFYLHLLERADDRWVYMSSAQDLFAEIHKIRD